MDLTFRAGAALESYDPLRDRHLRSYYARPEVQKNVTRSKVAAAVAQDSSDPWFVALDRLSQGGFHKFVPEQPAAGDTSRVYRNICGCKSADSCPFCASELSRSAFLSRSDVRLAVYQAAAIGLKPPSPRPPDERPKVASRRRPATATQKRSARPRDAAARDDETPMVDTNPLPPIDVKTVTVRRVVLRNYTRAEQVPPPGNASAATIPSAVPMPPQSARRPQSAGSAMRSRAASNSATGSAEVVPGTVPRRRGPRPMASVVVEDGDVNPVGSDNHDPTQAVVPASVGPDAAEPLTANDNHSSRTLDQDLHAEASEAPPPPAREDPVLVVTGRVLRLSIQLQAWIRGVAVRLRLSRRADACRVIQQRYRLHAAARRMAWAARLLQRCGRGCQFRIRAAFYRRRSTLSAAALTAKAKMRKEIVDSTSKWGDVFKQRLAVVVAQTGQRDEITEREANRCAKLWMVELLARQDAAATTLSRELDESFARVLDRKQRIQSISARLVELERGEAAQRAMMNADYQTSYFAIANAMEQYAVHGVEEPIARSNVTNAEIAEFATLVTSCAMSFPAAFEYQWLRESEARLRHFVVRTEQFFVDARLRPEYSRVRLAFSASEKRKLMYAVEESERQQLVRAATKAKDALMHK